MLTDLLTLSMRLELRMPSSWMYLRGQRWAMAAVVRQCKEMASLATDNIYWPQGISRELWLLLRNTEKKFCSGDQRERERERGGEREGGGGEGKYAIEVHMSECIHTEWEIH